MTSREVTVPYLGHISREEDLAAARKVCREINAHLRGGDCRYAYIERGGTRARIVNIKIRHRDTLKWGETYDLMGRATDGTWRVLLTPARCVLSDY